MSYSKKIIKTLKKNKISFFTGVPDSILKNFSSKLPISNNHIITANEGGAISLATGYHLSSKKIPLVYFQNSGLGNTINPISSMAHKNVYGIPMILFVGWRGCPGKNDEVQHNVQGKITLKQLNLLNIKYKIFNKDKYEKQIKELVNITKKTNGPTALLFKKNDLKEQKSNSNTHLQKKLKIDRSQFLKSLIKISGKSSIIASTGFTSRELYQIRENESKNLNRDFYMVGAMGHTSMVALGISIKTKNNVICLDGDGSFLMHMGASSICANFAKENFKYILLNNGCHESVGSQPTVIGNINLKQFSKSLGYKKYFLLKDEKKIITHIKSFLKSNGPSFLEVKIRTGTFRNLKRIKNLSKIKLNFFK